MSDISDFIADQKGTLLSIDMMDIRKRLSQNLKKIMLKKGITMERFAYENNISKGYMYDVANGKANVSITMLQRIAKGLKVKPQRLIS